MLRLFLSVLFTFTQVMTFAQWEAKSISDSLKRNADAVIRRYATDIKFFEGGRINVFEDLVVTVFDKIMLEQMTLSWVIDESSVGNAISVKLYNSDGKRVKTKSRIANIDQNEKSNKVLLTDFFRDISDLSYPFTIEMEYKRSIININRLNVWKPVKDKRVSVQNACLRVTCIDTTLVNVKSSNVPFIAKSVTEDGCFVSLWELNDFQAINEIKLSGFPKVVFPFVSFDKK